MSRISVFILLLALVPIGAVCQQLPFGDVPPGIVKPSFGCDATAQDESSRRNCAAKELRYLDGRLNTRYRELRRQLRSEEVAGLVATQREWLKARDESCHLDRLTRDRDAWLIYIAQTRARTSCVMEATEKRLAELEQMQNQLAAPPMLAQVVPPSADAVAISGESAAAGAAGYLIRSARSRRLGKYYFEVVIEQARAREKLEASLIARINDGRRWIGTGYDIRPRNIELRLDKDSSVVIEGGGLPRVVIGVAVDLDAGRLYRHRDGNWLGGVVPGSPRGVELRRDAEYVAELSSSVRLEPLLQQGIVRLNYGDQPFERPPPAGYRGFDAKDEVAEIPHPETLPEIYSPSEWVAGTGQVNWVRRYWEWVRSFSAAESPSADASGYRCGAGQSGPVWFLTGSNRSASVQRECEIPEGKVLLVPIVNALAQASPGAPVACDKLLVTLRQFSAGVTDLRLKLNAMTLDRPERFLFGTGCFALREGSSAQSGLAAGTGYWVFVKPLKKGRHEIEFGGRFTADGFRQDIKYVLHVR